MCIGIENPKRREGPLSSVRIQKKFSHECMLEVEDVHKMFFSIKFQKNFGQSMPPPLMIEQHVLFYKKDCTFNKCLLDLLHATKFQDGFQETVTKFVFRLQNLKIIYLNAITFKITV